MSTDTVGGVWRYTLDLARQLSARGVPVHVATLGPLPSPGQHDEAVGLARTDTGLPLSWTASDPEALCGAVAGLRDLAFRLRAGAVHLHDPALAGSQRWSVKVVSVCHSCTATWWAAVRGGPLPADLAWRFDATRRGLDVSDAVIAPTRAHASAVASAYSERPIAVVHNGSDLPMLRGRRDRAVLMAGRLWDDAKRATLLNRIAPRLDAPVRAAGPTRGPQGGTVSLENLTLLGSLDVDGMRRAYADASVFASPARYEPFGLSVLEAARAGLRLVLADIPSFRELWDGAATFVTRDQDWPAALQSALDAPTEKSARSRAEAYRLGTMAEQTLALHRQLGAHV